MNISDHNTSPFLLRRAGSLLAGLIAVALFVLPPLARGQIINPTAPPPAGQTAVPLNTSSGWQWKLGSLIIGDNGRGNTKLCLNAPAGIVDPSTVSDPTCIVTWNELGAGLAGGFVSLRGEVIAVPGNLASYAAPQRGYVRLRGNQNTYGATLRSEANKDLGGSTALYADGLDYYNYAGYFSGRLAIEPTASTLGLLCLNSTSNDGAGHYCISHWSDIAPAAISNKLTLQDPSVAPSTEQGNVFIKQAFTAGSFIIGDPIALSVTLKCGDGMCSNYGPTPENTTNCSIDCALISRAATFTITPDINSAVLHIVTGSQGADPNVYVLVARSSTPTFAFEPVNGTSYAVGGTNALKIVIARVQAANSTYNFTDSGLTGDATYYYRVYQANLYPRYTPTIAQPGYLSASVLVQNGGGGECINCDPNPDPVRHPRKPGG